MMPAIQSAAVEDRTETLWRGVLDRDADLDGELIYAVRTTGIYCRPSCPARRPRRENVRIFAGPEAAEAAGFRACLRCRPRDGEADPALARVQAARAYLEAHLEETVTLERLAEEVGVSPWHLQRSFKRHLGPSPRQYVNQRRLERLRSRLREGEDDVTTALAAAGVPARLGRGRRRRARPLDRRRPPARRGDAGPGASARPRAPPSSAGSGRP